ncbi:hypothetical protein [Streptomyces sp. 8L]|uniref:hypothetical protein n=1 Tax=Streptomyces sp. 8L TaxID=2877242 RepID=UPI001CD21005|nr:hypothetical protein [Streptomyces sp. 8L]MCA1217004.1 hypothetical protein [Streptomyces sp. 8L]
MEESPVQNMIDALGTLRTTAAQPDPGTEQLAADVARGHSALNRRRRLRIAGVGVTAAVAAAAVTAAVTGPLGGQAPDVAARHTSRVPVSSAPAVPSSTLELAAYTGAQPVGFKVSTLPKGWKVTSVSQEEFVAVPPGTHESPSPQGDVSFANGIAVMLQGLSRFPAGASLTKVTVQGRTGQLGLTSDKEATWLMFPSEASQKVLIQVPVKLGLTNAQIVQFAQGVTATSDAKPGLG